MELSIETHVRSDDHQKWMQQFMNSRGQHFVVCYFLTFFFLKLLFPWIWWIYFFSFQDTYNSRLKERYRDDLLTHSDLYSDLWLETGSSGRSNRNRVYELFNTMIKNLRTTRSVLTIRCSQSILSTQTLKFMAMLDQQVQAQMTHLNEKYERLTTNYEELRRLLVEMRS
jgi:hypothetical protein